MRKNIYITFLCVIKRLNSNEFQTFFATRNVNERFAISAGNKHVEKVMKEERDDVRFQFFFYKIKRFQSS